MKSWSPTPLVIFGILLTSLYGCVSIPERASSPDPVFALEVVGGTIVSKSIYRDFSAGLIIESTDQNGVSSEKMIYLDIGMNFVGFPEGASSITVKKIFGRDKKAINPRTFSFILNLDWKIDSPAKGTILLIPTRFSYKEENKQIDKTHSVSSFSVKWIPYSPSEIAETAKNWAKELEKRSWVELLFYDLPPSKD